MQRSPACFSQRAADHARDFREADGWLADAAQPRWPGSPRRGKVASMSDSKPLFDPEAVRKITVAFESFVRAVEECVHPVIDALVQIAQDPAFRAALAADRQPGSPACHCRCEVVHRDEPCLCDGESAGSVRISDMNVPMCAPCQAARAAAKLAPP
jgi:hypothetical protein